MDTALSLRRFNKMKNHYADTLRSEPVSLRFKLIKNDKNRFQKHAIQVGYKEN